MVRIQIALGFIVASIGGFGLLGSLPANIILACIGGILLLNGSYEAFFKPHVWLDGRLTKWLLARNWKVRKEKRTGFYFIIWAEDESHRELAITRERNAKGVLAFTALVGIATDWECYLDSLTPRQRDQLVEDIRVFLASKDMSFDGALWPLSKLSVQHALPLDSHLSEHSVDLKAKEVVNGVIGIRSLIRKAIIPLESDKEGSPT